MDPFVRERFSKPHAELEVPILGDIDPTLLSSSSDSDACSITAASRSWERRVWASLTVFSA